MSLGPKELEFFKKVNKNTYGTQAQFFLNAFWDQGVIANAEEVWKFTQAYIRTDLHLKGLSPPNPSKEGTELDEHGFHYFLEKEIEPITVLAAREKFKQADVSFDGRVSLVEFLLWHYKRSPLEFYKNAPVDIDGETMVTPEIAKAYAALNAAKAEIQKIESEKDRLETEIETGGSVIKVARAQNELSQLFSRDNTDLNRALITAEAALRKLGSSGKIAPPGTIWYLSREVEEMKKYKPRAKQG